ncbi:MAG: DUF2726 domain-containing protein [Patescibacteria group bacterium]
MVFALYKVIPKDINQNGYYVRPKKKDYVQNRSSVGYMPYYLRQTIMTSHERLLFENLRKVLSERYDIYPQMKLDKIFSVRPQRVYKYYLGYLRKINQKSVDFLVVNKNTQSPIFAIELDDWSHEKQERIERDVFVQELFNRNNFPLVRFNPGGYSEEELRLVLEKYLN